MNELQIFNFDGAAVRTVSIGDEPYFIGKDVAEVLGYTNPRKALLDHVDSDDKTDGVTIRDSIGREQKPVCINESGLYSLIMSSKMPEAKRFKRWVTSEVLPSLRKHGMYAMDELLENPDLAINALQKLKEERARRKQLETENSQLQPKALFADAVSASHTSILIGDLAKILRQNGIEIGQKRLFQRLRDEGFLMKAGDSRNMPTQRAMEMGLVEIVERTINYPDGSIRTTRTPKVTGKGQVYFVNRFLKK